MTTGGTIEKEFSCEKTARKVGFIEGLDEILTITIINNIKMPSSEGVLLQSGSNTTHWSIADAKSNQLFLYNNQGKLIPGFPVKGSAGFDYLESVNYSGNAIVTGSPDGKISLYTTGE